MLYNLSIFLYTSAIRLASLWSPKARAWVGGRSNWRERYKQLMHKSGDRKKVWVHCASLGEFEQGRPVIEALRDQYPDAFIILSFFSPSGFEIRKQYNKADAVIYLPADTIANARDLVNILHPQLVIFIKYEYWLNILGELSSRKIPVLMVSAIFRKSQAFFRWYGSPWRTAAKRISHFFVQNDDSARLLQHLGISECTVSGDTRFDRVIQVQRSFTPVPNMEKFCNRTAHVIVAGSTWEKDEALLKAYLDSRDDVIMIIAPHEVDPGHIEAISSSFTSSIRFSLMEEGCEYAQKILVIDNIGMLSRLYHYADICYIGGGFGAGIHNTLEAAAYGKPVVFGPRYEKFREAVDMVAEGAAFPVHDQNGMSAQLDALLDDSAFRISAGERAGLYVQGKAGATSKVIRYIQEKRLLTS